LANVQRSKGAGSEPTSTLRILRAGVESRNQAAVST
jgi:hypothetical protein